MPGLNRVCKKLFIGGVMLYIIGYLLVSFVFVGIIFFLIEHSPSGWEDEKGFHLSPELAPHLNNSVSRHTSYTEIAFGNGNAHYIAHNS